MVVDSGHSDIVKSGRSPAGPDIDCLWLLGGEGNGEREKEGGREEGGRGGQSIFQGSGVRFLLSLLVLGTELKLASVQGTLFNPLSYLLA